MPKLNTVIKALYILIKLKPFERYALSLKLYWLDEWRSIVHHRAPSYIISMRIVTPFSYPIVTSLLLYELYNMNINNDNHYLNT